MFPRKDWIESYQAAGLGLRNLCTNKEALEDYTIDGYNRRRTG